MTFKTGKEMLDYINENNDLYSPSGEIYVFNYSECGSICVYYIDMDEAKKLCELSKENNEYWGAFLGFGGAIYDDPSHELYSSEQMSNLEMCERLIEVEDWVRCDELSSMPEGFGT